MHLNYIFSSAAGFALGLLFVVIWRKVMPSQATADFWRSLVRNLKNLTRELEPDKFLSFYKELIVQISRYMVRNVLALTLGSLPIIALLIFFAPTIIGAWDAKSEYIETIPSQGVTLAASGKTYHLTKENGRIPITFDRNSAGMLYTDTWSINLSDLNQKYGVCLTSGYCTLLHLLGFTVTDMSEKQVIGSADYFVVRPSHGDDNFAWPFLNDIEFYFFISLNISTIIGFILKRGKL